MCTVPLRNKPSIPQLIENLPFVKTVDLMLLEGTPVADVAKFIQDDQASLKEIHTPSLVTALGARRKKLRDNALAEASEETKRWFETGVIDDDDEEEDSDLDNVIDFPGAKPRNIPSAVSKQIYERHIQGGVDELIELEALYRTQRHRLDRLTDLEESRNGYIENLGKEYDIATKMLMARVAVKEKMGLIDGDQKFREQLDIKGYSEETVKTLSNPESRHRVVSLVEKLARLERKKAEKAAEEIKKTSEG